MHFSQPSPSASAEGKTHETPIRMQTASQYLKDVKQAMVENNLAKASHYCTLALKAYPENGDLWVALSDISLRLGQNKSAINMALKAINCAPQQCWHYFHLAGCYIHLHVFSAAKKVLEQVEKNMATTACESAWNKLGELYYMTNDLDGAMRAHQRALSLAPDSVSTRNHLAALLRFKGQLDDAQQLYLEVLERDPANYQACYNLSQLRVVPSDSQLVALIDNCEKQLAHHHHGHIMLNYAKGKAYEDAGQFDDAFASYQNGASRKRKQRGYSLERDIALMQSVVKACDSLPAPANAANTLAQSPVFVVGLPRTGTTLVERILSSHPDMVSGGELNAFPMALLEAGGKSLAAGLDGLDSALINALNDAGMAKLSSRYLQLANNYVEGAPRFIDKLPFNFLYCGFILHAMPHAKIVHVKRDPFDAAISNFKMLFDRGYEYSYDLADTAHFIAAYEALMQHWKARFPTQIHTVEYEKLVANQRVETEQLLQFCQLNWHDDCLHFHRNSSASHTASASQVREPIYQRSVDLWRQYDAHLAPLKAAFASHGILPTTARNNHE